MEAAWLILSGFVKLLFAFGPKLAKPNEFGLGAENAWKEAQDVASVSGTRGMLASLPVILAIQTFEKTETVCRGISPFSTVVTALVLVGVTILLLHTKADWLRGSITPFLFAAALVAVESGYTYKLRDDVAKLYCAAAADTKSSHPSGVGSAPQSHSPASK